MSGDITPVGYGQTTGGPSKVQFLFNKFPLSWSYGPVTEHNESAAKQNVLQSLGLSSCVPDIC